MGFGDCLVPQGNTALLTFSCLGPIVATLLTWAISLAGVAALFFVIFGGFKFLTSGGEKEKVEGARKTLTWAIIGLVVIFSTFGIVRLVAQVTGIACLTSPFSFQACGLPKNTCDEATAPQCNNGVIPACVQGKWESCGDSTSQENSCIIEGGDCSNNPTNCCGNLACQTVQGAHGISTCR